MAQTIKAIETQYRGYRFRSRLEARWAVFFDAMKIEWQYEAEGYVLSTGEWYLPDFWLPNVGEGFYVEVKPTYAPSSQWNKARAFARDMDKGVWCADGGPSARAYIVEDPYGAVQCVPTTNAMCLFYDDNHDVLDEAPNGGRWNFESFSPLLKAAVNAARSARFEYGETWAKS